MSEFQNLKEQEGAMWAMSDEKLLCLYEATVGPKNAIYYLEKFARFDKLSPRLKTSWNWPAFFFTGIWALYRKMYGWFFVFFGVTFLANILHESDQQWLGLLLPLVCCAAFAIFANSLYHERVKKKIATVQLTVKDDSRLLEYLKYKGGVNLWVHWVFGLIPVIATCAVIIISMLQPEQPPVPISSKSQYETRRKQVDNSPRQEGWTVFDELKKIEPLQKETPPPTSSIAVINSSPPPIIHKVENGTESWPINKADTGQGQKQALSIFDEIETFSAIATLEAEVTANPRNYELWTRLGNLYYDTKQPYKAIVAYTKSLELHKIDTDVLTDLGVMYRRTNQPLKAVEVFDKAIALDPSHQISRLNKGIVLLYDLNDPQGAIASWEALLKINPLFKTGNGESVREFIENIKLELADGN